MIILSTVLLIILNGIIILMVDVRFGRNWGLGYAVFSAAGITTALVLSLKAGL